MALQCVSVKAETQNIRSPFFLFQKRACAEKLGSGVKKKMGVVVHFVLDIFLVFILVLIQVCIRC